jgi:hypothetical protein
VTGDHRSAHVEDVGAGGPSWTMCEPPLAPSAAAGSRGCMRHTLSSSTSKRLLATLKRQPGCPSSCLQNDSTACIVGSTTVFLLSEFLQLISLRMTRWSSRSTTFRRSFVHHVRGPYSAQLRGAPERYRERERRNGDSGKGSQGSRGSAAWLDSGPRWPDKSHREDVRDVQARRSSPRDGAHW